MFLTHETHSFCNSVIRLPAFFILMEPVLLAMLVLYAMHPVLVEELSTILMVQEPSVLTLVFANKEHRVNGLSPIEEMQNVIFSLCFSSVLFRWKS